MANHNKPIRKERLEHILESVNKILKYTGGLDLTQFIDDEIIQLATIKLFEIIGESSYQLDKSFKKENDHIEWHKLEGLRHILVHDYYRIQPAILWNVRNMYLPDLKDDIEQLINLEN